jgi:hypothetical protein
MVIIIIIAVRKDNMSITGCAVTYIAAIITITAYGVAVTGRNISIFIYFAATGTFDKIIVAGLT